MKRRPPAELTAGELAVEELGRDAAQIVSRVTAVRLDRDPEDLHQFRVGIRRLRSNLRTFSGVLDGGWTGALQSELRWLDGAAGPARDADVQLDRLRNRLLELPDVDGPPASALLQVQEEQRAGRRRALIVALSSARFAALQAGLGRAAEPEWFPPCVPGRAGRVAAARPVMRKPWRRLARAVDTMGDPPSDAELHGVRILARRCRYAAEATVPLAGRPAERFARAVTRVQGLLGDHHDAVVAESWLRATAAQVPGAALPAGELVLLERLEQGRLQGAWPATWEAVSAPELRAWF